ncbi:5-formyltetrahydrofolate cyclo-ligase [Prosthecomicrobium sp. N25]|uniref:5-formyltetrahydrofolate cyclo-ligase n=1 Tax=Prosthecomicrobium sp. N25 TaxID=3129254 RepID=UPI0030770F0A
MRNSSAQSVKADLRAGALARRGAIADAEKTAAAERIAAAIEGLPLPAGALVSGFLPIRGEVDPRPALERLAARHHPLCLPVVLEDRTTMVFRAWKPGDALVPSSFGLSVPVPEAPVVEPSVMLVPLAAFDRRGYRIGYGKGHYDRAIERLAGRGPLLEIGIAFACQEIEHVPAEPHDRPMQVVVTEEGAIPCRRDA